MIRHLSPFIKKDVIFEALRFGTIGGLATITHAIIAWLSNLYIIEQPYTANLIGFLFALLISYTGHFFWTFNKRSGIFMYLFRFLVISLSGFALSNFTILIINKTLGAPFEIALVLNIALIPILSWFLNRTWVFSR